MSRKKLLVLPAILIVGMAAYYLARSGRFAQTTAIQGTIAPDFDLPQLNGGQLKLSAYRGKVVLLDFWATWCDPCREEVPHFIDLQNRYGPSGLQILGVSMDDSPEPVRDFYQQLGMNYPVVMGNARIGELYGGVLGLPIAFVIDRDGRIQDKHIGAVNLAIIESEVVKLLSRSARGDGDREPGTGH